MENEDDKARPAKQTEHGASRKHDQVTTTEEEDKAPRDTYFNDDGNINAVVVYHRHRARRPGQRREPGHHCTGNSGQ